MLDLGAPAYLYVGVDDVRAAVDFYERALDAEFLWHFRRFGTEVAAVRVSGDGRRYCSPSTDPRRAAFRSGPCPTSMR